jgi:predicted ATPase
METEVPASTLLVFPLFCRMLARGIWRSDYCTITVRFISRASLRLRAEQELRLSPLMREDAVMLFRERAQAVRPGRAYAMDEVAAICEQVDRLPLAIELAAMHIKLFSLPELQKRLSHRLALLRGGARDPPARQQTMEDAIAWSYELLTEEQRRCFCALGVFAGGWTLEAALAGGSASGKGAAEESILSIAALVDASLVQADTSEGTAGRSGMLGLIRDYALQQLHITGEEEAYRRRHATYYARLAETITAHFGPESGVRAVHFASALAQELPNARAALQWAEERQEAELGLRLAGFARLWHVRGQMSEAERWMERMLALDRRAREQGKPGAPLPLRISFCVAGRRKSFQRAFPDKHGYPSKEPLLRGFEQIVASLERVAQGLLAQSQRGRPTGQSARLPLHWHCSRKGQGRQLRMRAAGPTRRLLSRSRRRSCGTNETSPEPW